jgi:hypothetical protein
MLSKTKLQGADLSDKDWLQTLSSNHVLAHDGTPLTALYEHMSPDTLPCSTHAWKGTM